ncbi:hypothetical protein PB1_11209 [Bacillus methanolicus PB1]|uniref:Permease n=1 Tax=Bacillus methanolicus PB1 TaxID=997296 RepID=I3DV53_BACMT|nr:permease [Bacillus methanolicus]EIJ78124.1 hypothetical protein PB1_11209 [Bacillus methanolicus PB1]
MDRLFRSYLLDFTGIFIIGFAVYFLSFGINITVNNEAGWRLPPSLLNLNTIFLSILIEALPFVLIGVLIAGMIQIFVKEEHIQRCIPKNKFLAVMMSCVVGACFPACECGIVPIVRKLVAKGVPIYAGIGFLLTGPLINPIVIASTYMAFGNNLKISLLRMIIGFFIAIFVAIAVSFLFKGRQFKETGPLMDVHSHSSDKRLSFTEKFWSMLKHSIDEFFDMGRYLIIGALFAAFVQTYLPAKSLLEAGSGLGSSTLVMMGLAYIMSLCSEADAFIGASFSSIFPTTSILGFLVFGPMIDLKNTIMMLSVFRTRFVLGVLVIITISVFTALMLLHPFI